MKKKIILFILLLLIVSFFYTYKLYSVLSLDFDKEVLLGGNSIGIKANIDDTKLNDEDIQINMNDYSAGTLTYIDPSDNSFGALGHTYSQDNSMGQIYDSYVVDTVKSNKTIGYKIVAVDNKITLGDYYKDSNVGIFGVYNYQYNNDKLLKIAMPKEIKRDKAYIATTLDNNKIEYFEIEITFINYTNKKTNIYFTITDKDLLNRTNGLISGMSGSPIIQNNKIIGAVSSANKNNLKKGYGVFITSMINEKELV